jgi:hypothetical protein
VQVARDSSFTTLVADTTTSGTALTLPGLEGGLFNVRVAAVDNDGFEGAWSAPSLVNVGVMRVVPGEAGRRATVDVPPGFFCAIDGGSLAPVERPIPLTPALPHEIKCATNAEGTGALTAQINAHDAGPLVSSVSVSPDSFDPNGGMRIVALRLSDAIGSPVSYARVSVVVSDGAQVQPVIESTRVRGTYTTSMQYRPGLRMVRIHFVVNDTETVDYVFGPDLPRGS